MYNGYILDFVSKFKEIYVNKPAGYSEDVVDELADQYKQDMDLELSETELPHIIVIMDESFSDLNVMGELSTNIEVTPFISGLKENTISGYALASVYGGNTANSEYEFLTGNSMAWLSPNSVPYQQYVDLPTYSMASYLKMNYDYRCIAMHPYSSSGWNRPEAYKYLGFDEIHFLEDFPQKQYIREYVSDQEMFETIIKTYEEEHEEPLFLFSVSMQNHGGYGYSGENYEKSVSLLGYHSEYPEAEQYLTLIHETDKAVEYLISYFENVNENVVIVFFGDHQPKMEEAFYRELCENEADSLEQRQKRHKIPFFIWTNYETDEKRIDCTSLNYLSSYVYEAAGITLPLYNQFLSELEEKIPAINANGFYSLEKQGYVSFDEASEEEQSWIKKYEQLQYNSLFDEKNRNRKFFPVIE